MRASVLAVMVCAGESVVGAPPLTVFPKASSVATFRDACGRGFQTVFRNVTNRQAEAHSRAARNYVESRLSFLLEGEEELLLKHGARPAARGVVEVIPENLNPTSPALAAMAKRASEILQSRNEMLGFVETVAREVKVHRTQGWSPGVDPVVLLPAQSIETSVFQGMAERMGWGAIVPVRHPVDDAEGFRIHVLGSSQLFFDVEAIGSRHTASAHFLQWLMITPKLDAEFGPGSAKLLLKHFSTPEGIRLWGWMFDRGPANMRDFRSPRAFHELQLVGKNSWFGVE